MSLRSSKHTDPQVRDPRHPDHLKAFSGQKGTPEDGPGQPFFGIRPEAKEGSPAGPQPTPENLSVWAQALQPQAQGSTITALRHFTAGEGSKQRCPGVPRNGLCQGQMRPLHLTPRPGL